MKRLAGKLAAVICLMLFGIISKGNIKGNLWLNESKDSLKRPLNELTPLFLPDWKKAPNSYIFDPNQNSEGLLVPVKKLMRCGKEADILTEAAFRQER